MIQFDKINSHPKHNLITKTTFKIICLFVKLALHTHTQARMCTHTHTQTQTHTHTHTHCQTEVMSLLNVILSCFISDSFKANEHSYSMCQRRVENAQLTTSDINNHTRLPALTN